MSYAKALLAFLAASSLYFAPMQTQQVRPAPRFTGAYTNMYYNEEGGDVLGEELKIVLTQGGHYEGALQFAEGEPEGLILVSIELKGNAIGFSVPDATPHAGRFSGTIDRDEIHGQFIFKGGGTETVDLKKGKSYWD
ncbi:MAG: hypothetical protein WB780_14100 [Candidatus Acidiferrales bacterium]